MRVVTLTELCPASPSRGSETRLDALRTLGPPFLEDASTSLHSLQTIITNTMTMAVLQMA